MLGTTGGGRDGSSILHFWLKIDVKASSSSSEVFNHSPPFRTGSGRTAKLRSDPLVVGSLSSVYHLLLMLFCMQIVLFWWLIRLIPHLQVCLVLHLACPPALSIEPELIPWLY
eukprot:g16501.t1